MSVSIAAGEASGSIVIPVKGDTVDELNETVEVTLVSATNASVSTVEGADEGSGTITDDDSTPTGASLSVDPGSVAEDASKAATVTVTARLSGSTTFSVDKTVSVTVGKASDSAKSGTDYAAVDPFTVTIAAGASSGFASFDLDPTDDSLDESTESLSVSGSSTGLTVSGASVSITDDDAAPSVSIADATAVTEGDDPETTSDMTFTVSLSAVSGKPVTVTYSLDGTATSGSDYTAPDPLLVSIPAGEASGSITIPVKGDVVDEANETVEVTLVSATNASLSSVAGATVGEGTITDDDAAPSTGGIVVDGGSVSLVPENVVEAPTISFTVSLDGTVFAVDKTVKVTVGKEGDAAVSGVDYEAVEAFTITIKAGESSGSGSFVLDPVDDSLDEPNEAVTVVGSLDGVTISSMVVMITDDDAAPSVSIADATAVTEGDDPDTTKNMTFTVTLSAVSGKDVTVTYSLAGSASAGSDYTAPNPLSVSIAAGSQTGSIVVAVKGDTVDELNETVEVTLTGATNATVSATEKVGEGTITDDDATPAGASLSVAPSLVAEDATEAATITVTATLAGDTTFSADKTVTVTVGDKADTAKSGVDYAAVDPFTVTIPAGAGSGSASFDLNPTDDGLDEPTESVSVAGSSAGLTVSGASVSITDDDAAPSVSVGDAAAVTEGDDPNTATNMTFTVTLSAVSGKAVTVTYSLGGSATLGSDYTAPDPLTVTIPAGEASGSIVVAVKGDTVDELNETVEVTLVSATNATVSATEKVGEGTITDDDATPAGASLSVAPGSVAEDASQAATITVTATLAGSTTFSTDKTVTVTVGAAGDTAVSATDYAAVDPFTVTIAAGASSGSASFDLDPVDDSLDEPTESLSVSGSLTGLTVSGASVEITDDDAEPTVSVGDASAVTEGDDSSATTNMTFTVSLSAVSGRPVTVTYSLGGSASAGSDYTAPSPLSVSIAAGSQTGSIVVPVKGDVVDELNETVEVTLVSATNASVSTVEGADEGSGTITDDDATPTGASLSVDPGSVGEDASEAATVTVTATLSGSTTFNTAKTVTVTVGAAGDTAKSGVDYAAVDSFDITISAGSGSGSASFDLDPTDDDLDEPTESVSVVGSSTRLTVSSSSVSITDDDAAPSVSIADASAVTEGDDPNTATNMTFTVTLSVVSGRDVTVTYTLGGSATAGSDYTAPSPLSVTIAAGSQTGSITVPVKGDTVDELNETVEVTLVSATNASLSSVAGATVGEGTITDDDSTPTGASLSVAPSSVAENITVAATITVTATLAGSTTFDTDKTVTVTVGAAADTAKSGVDYAAVDPFTITIAAGTRTGSASFDLDPTDDSLDEPTESLTVAGSVSGLTVSGVSVSITDDDAAPTVSVGDASAVSEGDDSTKTTDMTFTVTLSAVSGKPVTVTYSLGGSATAGSDYTAPDPLSVSIPAGEASGSIVVAVKGDVVDELNETVEVTLVSATNASLSSVAGATVGEGTITDDDATPAGASLSVAPGSVTEDATEAATITVTATLAGSTTFSTDKTVTVTVGDKDDTAKSGTDYTAVDPFTVTIAAGASSGSASFDLDPTDDSLDEPTESLTVAGAAGGLTVSGVSVSITDDDAAPTVSVGDATAVAEGDDSTKTTNMTFTVTLSAVSGKPVTVTYSLGGSATAGSDYTAPDPLSVSIPAGEASGSIVVPVKGDVVDELNETVEVTLTGATNASLSSVQGATVGEGTITDDDATPTGASLSVAPSSVAEDASNAVSVTVTATLSGSTTFNTAKTVTVTVGDKDDTAKSGTDYTAVDPFTVTIAAGASSGSASFDLDPTDDGLDEPTESLTVAGSVSGLTVSGASVEITDDDAAPSVSIADAAAVSEGDDPETTSDMTFTVTLSAVSGKPVTVTYSLGGSATAGSDYTAPNPLSVSIAAGEASDSITIPVKGDVVDELNETVEVTLTGATNATLGSDKVGEGTITDDDSTPTTAVLSVDPSSVAEDASQAATITVTATLAGSTTFSTDKTVTVTVGDKDDTAKSGTDYAAVDPFTITIPAGDSSGSASFDLNPTDDRLDEPTETLTVAGAAGGLTVSGASVSITDDDAAPSVSIADASAVSEGDDPETTSDMTFTVSLSAVSGKAVTVTYSLGGSATAGSDYTAPSPLSVSIPAGEASGSIVVAVKGDTVDELNETIEVTLVSATNASLSSVQGATVGEGTITDDDATPTGASLSVAPSSVAENATETATVTVTATLSGSTTFNTAKTVSVTVGKASDSAKSGTDYAAVDPFTITIPAGDSSGSASFDLDPTDDSLDEPTESLSVSGSLTGLTVSGASVSITDDDAAPTVSVGDASAVSEGDDPETTSDMTFTVTLSAVSGRDVTVTYSLGGSATAGSDYTAPDPLSVTIPAGEASGSIVVAVKGDTVDELNETVEVTLTGATNATLGSDKVGEGTITDDDITPTTAVLSVDPSSVAEDASEAATVTVTATLAGSTTFSTDKTVTVTVGKASDSAKSGTDYTAVDPLTITIAAGASSGSASFDLDPTDDSLDEPTESLSVAGSAGGLTVSGASVSISDDDAAPSVSIADASAVTEGDDSAKTTDMTFTVTLSAVSGKPVTVTYTLGGSATAGSDYTVPDPLSVSIPAGSLTGSIVISVKGDTVDELNETVEVTLVSATNASLSSVQGATVGEGTITDDDAAPAGASLSVAPSSVAEDASEAATVTVTATLAGSTTFSTDKTVTVTVGKASDSAKSGTDYTAVDPLTITIAAGASSGSASFDLDPTDDSLDEPTESVSVAGSAGGLTVSGASVSITDDDAAPSVSIADASAVTEGDDPNTATNMTFTVTLSAVSGKPVTVTYTLGGSATAGSDYTVPDPLSVSIPAGEASGSIVISVKGDTVDELNETVEVTLVSATNASLSSVQGATVGEGTITDDDAAPAGASLSVAPSSVAEDASEAATVTVTATLAGSTTFSTDKTVTVTVGKASDSAKSGTDYTAVDPLTITIAAGASSGSASFDLDPTDDSLDEPTESVSVAGSAGGLTVSGASVSITDDDAAPSVSIADASAVTEGDDPNTATNMTFTVTLSAVSGKPVTVTYTLGGSATAGSDYTVPDPLSVSIPAGEASGSIVISVKGDTVDELNETVEVTLVSATNASLSSVQGATVGEGTITDDDAAPAGASLSVAPSSVAEDASEAATVTVTATLAGSTTFSTDKTVTVTVGKASDSAKSGTDYTAVDPLTITIAAGASSGSASFDLDPTDDSLDEPTESVSVAGSAGGLTVSGASVSITDDDAAPSVSIADASAVTEGDDPETTSDMTFTVTLSAVSGKPVTVTYTLGGSATAGSDYTAPNPLSVTIPAGSQTGSIIIPVKGDTVDESNETVEVTLVSATNATVSASEKVGEGTITDDDDTPKAAVVAVVGGSLSSVAENVVVAPTISFTVTLQGSMFDVDKDVTVVVGKKGDTAVSGTDYKAVASFTVTIPAGASSVVGSFVLDPTDDSLDEPDEILTISGLLDGVTISSTTVTITDDDDPPTVSIADATAVTEGDDSSATTNMTFTVSLSAVSGKPVTVTYSLGGSASAGSDYTAPDPLSVSIAAGSQTGSIIIPVKGDTVDESNETVEVTLTGATNATLSTAAGATVGEGTITDDDATPTTASLSVTPTSVSEGASQAATVTVTATLSGTTTFSADKTVTVTVGDTGDTAVSGTDYQAVNSFDITISAGTRSGSATFDLDPTDDTLDESNETLTVTGLSTGLTISSATVTITDDDDTLSVSVADAAKVTEGDDPDTTTNMTFTVTLSATSGQPVTVTYSLGGTATSGADFTAPNPLSVTIPAGESSGSIIIPVKGDVVDEPDETIEVTLTGATNASLSTATGATVGEGTIADNDPVPMIAIEEAVVVEGGKAAFVVSLANPSSQAVTFKWKTADDTRQDANPATAGVDYTAVTTAQTVTLPAGDTTVFVEVQTLEDNIKDGDETFMVVLSSPVNAVLSPTKSTTMGTITDRPLTLINKDRPTVTVIADYARLEGNAVVVAVLLSAPLDVAVDIPLKFPPHTAHTTAADELHPHRTFYIPDEYTSLSFYDDQLNEIPDSAMKTRSKFPSIRVERGKVAVINTIENLPRHIGENRKFTVELDLHNMPPSVQSGMPDAVEATLVDRGMAGPASRWWRVLAEGGRTVILDVLDAQARRYIHEATVRGSEEDADYIREKHNQRIATLAKLSYGQIDNPSRAVLGAAVGEFREVAHGSVEAWWDGLDCRLRRMAVGEGREADATSSWCSDWSSLDQTEQSYVQCIYKAVFTDEDLNCGPEVNVDRITDITDRTTPTDASLSVAPSSVSEDAAQAVSITVTATLSGTATFSKDETVTVTVGHEDDSAESGTDYAAVDPFTITIPAGTGSGSATFSLDPTDDSLDEPTETLSVSGISTALTVSSTSVLITDDDLPPVADPPSVSVGDATAVTEGDDPSAATDMTFTVSLSATSDQPVTVTYSLGGSATADSDYTAPNPLSVTIPAGSLTGSVVIPVRGDVIDEPNEKIEVTLTGATNATLSTAAGATVGEGTITDDDSTPTAASLSVTPTTVSEGASQAVTITVTARLSGSTTFDTDKTVTVTVGDTGDIAVSGTDYQAVNSFDITIFAGTRSGSATFDLEPTDDTLDEPNETLTVTGTSTGLTVSSALVSITDDDAEPSVSIGDAAAVTEGDNPRATTDMTFTVSLSAISGQPVTVTYSLGGTATSGADFTAPNPLSVTIPAGSQTGSITIPVKGDVVDEPDETIEVTLTGATNASLSTATGATVGEGTIADDDPVPMIAIREGVAVEGGKAVFVVSLVNPSSQAVTFKWLTADDTRQDANPATAGVDYTAVTTAQTVTIPAGDTTVSVEVQTLVDNIKDGDETFMVMLSSPINAVLSPTRSSAVGTITDGHTGLINQVRPTVTLIADYARIEGHAVVVAVLLSAPLNVAVDIPVKFPPHTAHTTAADEFHPHPTFYMPNDFTSLSYYDAEGNLLPDSEKPKNAKVPAIRVERGKVAVINTIEILPRNIGENRKFTVELDLHNMPPSVQSGMPDAVEVTVVDRGMAGPAARWWRVLAEGGRTVILDVLLAQDRRYIHDATVRGSEEDADDIREKHDKRIADFAQSSYGQIDNPSRAVLGAAVGEFQEVAHGSVEAWWDGLDCRLRRMAVGESREADATSSWCSDWSSLDQTEQDYATCIYKALFTTEDLDCGPVPTLHTEQTVPDGLRFLREVDTGLKISLAAGSASIPEDGGAATITIKLDRVLKSGETVTVPLEVTGAQAGVHYTLALPSDIAANAYAKLLTTNPHSAQHPAVKLGAGARTATLKLAALPNDDTEKRTVEIAYGQGSRAPSRSGFGGGITLSGSPVEVDIVNDDDATDQEDNAVDPVVSVEDATSVTEGDDSSATTNMTFTVTLSRVGSEAITVTYTLGGTATSGSDFTAPKPLSVTIPAGKSSGSITIPVIGDVIDEPNETIRVTLTGATNATLSTAAGATVGEGTITDDDDAPTGIALSTQPGAVSEEGKAVKVTVTATVSGGTTYAEDREIAVKVGQADDSAVSGVDYGKVKDLTVVIPAGAASARAKFSLSPTDNNEDEADKTITVVGSSAGLTISSAEITIEDDDEPVIIPTLSVSDASDDEGNYLVVFSITLSEASTRTITVTVKTRDGSAIEPLDYSGYYYGETITFEPGETRRYFQIPIRDDDRKEGDETFELVVTEAVGAEISDGVGLGTIIDDD